MLSRDFSRPNKEYIKKNKFVLISILTFLVVGLVIACVFGFNGNFEINGYNEFTVKVGTQSSKTINNQIDSISEIVDSIGGDFDTASILDEGDLTKIVVRYSNNLSEEKQIELNESISEELEIEVTKISKHIQVDPVVENKDYIYTACAILILLVAATIFAYVRYNGASAVAIIVSCALGTLGFLSVSAILRLSIGMSYFAMLVILNLLIVYCATDIFENMRDNSFLADNDYKNAIESAVKSSRFKLCLISIAIMIIGVLFVIIAPNAIRFVSLNIMFMAVTLLAVSCYVVPFVWSMLITHCNKRKVKKEKNKK